MSAAICHFHESVDTLEVAHQLSELAASDILTLPVTDFKLPERAAIAGMIFKPFPDERTHIEFPRLLVRLCQSQETRYQTTLKLKRGLDQLGQGEMIHDESRLPSNGNKQRAKHLPLEGRHSKDMTQISTGCTTSYTGDNRAGYPIILNQRVCLICIGNAQYTRERRLQHIPRRDLLNKYLKFHFRSKTYQRPFQC